MPAGDRDHGLLGRALVALLVVALLLGGVAAWRFDLVAHLGGDDAAGTTTADGPAALPPPRNSALAASPTPGTMPITAVPRPNQPPGLPW